MPYGKRSRRSSFFVAARRVVEFVAILIAATAVAGGYAAWMTRQSACTAIRCDGSSWHVAPGSGLPDDVAFRCQAASDFLWQRPRVRAWRAKY